MKKSDIRSLLPDINKLFLQIHSLSIYNSCKINI